MFDPMPSLGVDLVLTIEGQRITVKGLVSICPFCDNLEGDREACGLCVGAGLIIKLLRPPPQLKLRIIPGGKVKDPEVPKG